MFRFAQHDKRFQLSLRGIAEAIKRHRILMILASHTVGYHARTLCSLAMTHPLAPSAREGEESHNNKNGRIGGATLVALIRFYFVSIFLGDSTCVVFQGGQGA